MANYTPDELRQQRLADAKRMLQDGKFASTQKQRQRDDKNRRNEAEKAPKSIFLRPSDLSGDYDFDRALKTTLGGTKDHPVYREISPDDLVVFARNLDVIKGRRELDSKQRYIDGITPQQVIDWSLAEDRERSNREIHLCAPFRRKGNVQRFMTNASKGSEQNNHFVSVEFLNFNDLVTQPRKVGVRLTRKELAEGRIKFECDCGKHTFWFRYIATIGGYAYGRQENGFPKIRNPNLQGVACKHVLRVMHFITSPLGVQYMQNQVNKDRQAQLGQTIVESDAQLKERLEHQANTAHHQKHQVLTTAEREALPAHIKRMQRRDAAEAKKNEEKALKKRGQEQADRDLLSKLKSISEGKQMPLSSKEADRIVYLMNQLQVGNKV